ncbi:hypothetical protein MASR2M79_00150 [Aminivibrio sp.]
MTSPRRAQQRAALSTAPGDQAAQQGEGGQAGQKGKDHPGHPPRRKVALQESIFISSRTSRRVAPKSAGRERRKEKRKASNGDILLFIPLRSSTSNGICRAETAPG